MPNDKYPIGDALDEYIESADANGEHDKALEAMENLDERRKNTYNVMFDRGRFYLCLDKPQEAVKAFQSAARLKGSVEVNIALSCARAAAAGSPVAAHHFILGWSIARFSLGGALSFWDHLGDVREDWPSVGKFAKVISLAFPRFADYDDVRERLGWALSNKK